MRRLALATLIACNAQPALAAIPSQSWTITLPRSIPSLMPVVGKLTSRFGWRQNPFRPRSRATFHAGLDLAAPRGTPVYAAADGTIASAGRVPGYGLMLAIDHGGSIETRYAHLSLALVRDGAKVRRGELIGRVGASGRATGSHLHYEVRVEGAPVDPLLYTKRIVMLDAPVHSPTKDRMITPGTPLVAFMATSYTQL